ncbi:putative gustatory receptor 28b [Belonocnema kinseyi]|uniref:putative gustatory receptor 28b n=1 Tax=Belonocnema kinseyi TaxID=2817044 RepID=UPI00143D9A05|nr:putative gustatory receptor 28b [Belonocnema kinseyi]
MTNLKTIEDVMLPMRVLNWIVGCGGIIEYPLNNPHVVMSLVYSAACTLNYCLLTYLCVYYNNNNTLSGNIENGGVTRSDNLFQIFSYANTLVTVVTIFMGWRRGKGVKIIIQSIQKVDVLLRKLGILDEYDKMFMKQIFLTAFTVTMITILTIINGYTLFMCAFCSYDIKMIFVMKYNYPVGIMFINDITFISYIRCLRRKFQQLNDMLKTMSGASPLYPQYMKLITAKTRMDKTQSNKLEHKTNDDTQMIRVAKQAHLALVRICKRVNNIFRLHLLMSMTLASVFIIYFSYNAYTVYLYSHEKNKSKEIISSLNYLLFFIMKILTVNHICDRTSLEALKTGSIVCELHEPATSKEFRLEIGDFTLQLIQNPLKFSAFGIVTLDHTFIQDVVGTITTYLVILVQLRDMTESK